MELNISELDNMNPYETPDYNSGQQNALNYWEKPVKTENKERKKKVSFDDILSNMNVVVNKQGVLQFMVPAKPTTSQQNNTQDYNYQYSQNNYSQQNYYQPPIQEPIQQPSKSEPLEPAVKHSYIYNKYFKDYVDPNAEKPGPRVPKTMEEYRQMLLEDRIRAIEHKKRIEQIKSTKLLFTTTPGIGQNPRNLVASKNSLRRMTFN